VVEVDVASSATSETTDFDSRGNVVRTKRLLDKATGATSCTEYGYGQDGRRTFERKLLYVDPDGTSHWLHTAFVYTGSTTGDPSAVVKKGQIQTVEQLPQDEYSDEPIALGSGIASSTPAVVTSSQYDAFGNEVAAIDALGNTTAVIRDLEGRVLSSVDASGVLAVCSRYNALGQEVANWREAGAAVAEYVERDVDVIGHVVTETHFATDDGLDSRRPYKSIVHEYDSMGRETGLHDSEIPGTPARMVYDAAGNLVQSWADGLTPRESTDIAFATVRTHDSDGRTLSCSVPGAMGIVVTSYDQEGKVATETAADGTTTTRQRDAQGRETAVSVTSPSGAVSTIRTEYDAGGRPTAKYDASGFKTEQSYDLANRPSSATGPSGRSSSLKYNALDWVMSAVDVDGVTVSLAYDMMGNPVIETVGCAGAEPFSAVREYDAGRRVLSRFDTNGARVSATYDGFGRVEAVNQAGSAGTVKHSRFAYDSLSRLVENDDESAGVSTKIVYPSVGDARVSATAVTSYAGLVVTATLDARGVPFEQAVNGPGVSIVRSVDATDAARRVTGWSLRDGGLWGSRRFGPGGRIVAEDGPAFDDDGAVYEFGGPSGRMSEERLPLKQGSGGGIHGVYEYDVGGRLVSAGFNSGLPASFSFDSAGRVATFTTTVERTGETTSGLFSYDANGRLAVRRDADGAAVEQYGYDARGNRTGQWRSDEASAAYAYDGANRLVHYGRPDLSRAATYTYDAAGQRVRSVVSSGAAVSDTRWAYLGRRLMSVSSTVVVGSQTENWRLQYLYDEDGKPYAAVYASDTTTATLVGLVTTAHGDVVALTDRSGVPFASYRYDAWGRDLGVAASGGGSVGASTAAEIAERQPIRYAGYVYDSESGFYYLSARHYDPSTFQFLQKDPLRANGEGSPYQYCNDDPVNYVDPTGRSATLVFEGLNEGPEGGNRTYTIDKGQPLFNTDATQSLGTAVLLPILQYVAMLIGASISTTWFPFAAVAMDLALAFLPMNDVTTAELHLSGTISQDRRTLTSANAGWNRCSPPRELRAMWRAWYPRKNPRVLVQLWCQTAATDSRRLISTYTGVAYGPGRLEARGVYSAQPITHVIAQLDFLTDGHGPPAQVVGNMAFAHEPYPK
jgi:RHS repeat-associated protein